MTMSFEILTFFRIHNLINLKQRIIRKLKISIEFEGGEVTYDELYICQLLTHLINCRIFTEYIVLLKLPEVHCLFDIRTGFLYL
jgi:hypothetical protein